MLPFLRPLGPPRPATLARFLRFSTSSRCPEAVAPKEDRNLAASRYAPESYPPSKMRSNPRPKISKASRRTNHPTKERPYPTRRSSHHKPEQQKLIPQPVAPLEPSQCAPNLPYFVTRSANNELPIYTLRKRGGNLLVTRVKKIDGDRAVLKQQLKELLGRNEVVVNGTTGHIMIKGHVKPIVEKFLKERLF